MIWSRLARLLPSDRPRWLEMPSWVASNFVDNSLVLLAALEKHQIEYVIHFGTLLGAVRLGGVLPWDDDFDVYLPHESLPAVRRIESDLRQCGVELVYDEREFYWVRQRGWLAASGHVGLSPLTATGEQALSPEELYPLRRYPFYGTEVWGPAQPERILERIYGASGTVEALGRFRAAPLDRRRQALWSRPLADWDGIVSHFQRRPRWGQAACWPWWWVNGAYLLAIRKLARYAQTRLQPE